MLLYFYAPALNVSVTSFLGGYYVTAVGVENDLFQFSNDVSQCLLATNSGGH